jgi:LmbE family N-acetylglucosaminyl deacetylase/SAM-dependent methyltransferase
VTPFDPSAGGNLPARWWGQPWWRTAPLIGLPPTGTRIVILAAHPDDETLGIGGFLAAAALNGNQLTVVIGSDGRGSHPASRSHSPADLARIRRVEAQTAVGLLAPSAQLYQVDLPDGDLASFRPELTVAIESALGPDDDCWLLSTWLGDAHPDHAACAEVARAVAAGRERTRLFEYPIWFWHVGDPEHAPTEFLDGIRLFEYGAAERSIRDEALRAYPSQIEPLSDQPGDEVVLPAGFIAHFDRTEDVLLDVGRHPAGAGVYFDDLYRQRADPWDLGSSWYERRKRDAVLAALPRERFGRGLEVGSARGDLSLRLLDRVEELLAIDGAREAVAATQARVGTRAQTAQMLIPGDWPPGAFELIVLSEVGYYVADLNELAARIGASLDPEGVLVLVHWRHVAKDHPHTAETVHRTLSRRLPLSRLSSYVDDDFLLDVLARDGRSVAEREGR